MKTRHVCVDDERADDGVRKGTTMSRLNNATLIGNLGRDAKLTDTSKGTAVTTVRVATMDIWNDHEKVMEHTEWHRVVIGGETGERLAEYLVKQVYIEGTIHSGEWTNNAPVTRMSFGQGVAA